MTAAIESGRVLVAILCRIELDSGNVCVWSGRGDFIYGGETYSGVGNFGNVSSMDDAKGSVINGITLTLSGIPPEMISLAIGEHYRGRNVRIWIVFFGTDGTTVLSDPIQRFAGRADIAKLNDGPDTAAISITVESRLVDIQRARERRFTHEDQQQRFPGDYFFEYVPALQGRTIPFGPTTDAGATTLPVTSRRGS
jgi:hypothetical protein